MFFLVSVVLFLFSYLKMFFLTFLVLYICADLLAKWYTSLTTVLHISEFVGMLVLLHLTSVKSSQIEYLEQLLNVVNATYKIHVVCSIHISEINCFVYC